MFYLTTLSTHFIYNHLVLDMVKNYLIEKTHGCHFVGYSFGLARRDF